jgi:hypothetical protein
MFHLSSYTFLGIPELVCCFLILSLKLNTGDELNEIAAIDATSLLLSLMEFPYICGVLLHAMRIPIPCPRCGFSEKLHKLRSVDVPCVPTHPEFSMLRYFGTIIILGGGVFFFVGMQTAFSALLGSYFQNDRTTNTLVLVGAFIVYPFQFYNGHHQRMSLVNLLKLAPWVKGTLALN